MAGNQAKLPRAHTVRQSSVEERAHLASQASAEIEQRDVLASTTKC